jgi:pimeloyl-ACP methyl ester carboxylesterase
LFTIPALLISTSACSTECGERYAKALPKARLAVVEGAGHFVEMEQPDAVGKLVTEFAAAS